MPLEKPEVRVLVLARGGEVVAGTPEALAALLKREIACCRKIMAEAGIRAR